MSPLLGRSQRVRAPRRRRRRWSLVGLARSFVRCLVLSACSLADRIYISIALFIRSYPPFFRDTPPTSLPLCTSYPLLIPPHLPIAHPTRHTQTPRPTLCTARTLVLTILSFSQKAPFFLPCFLLPPPPAVPSPSLRFVSLLCSLVCLFVCYLFVVCYYFSLLLLLDDDDDAFPARVYACRARRIYSIGPTPSHHPPYTCCTVA